MKRLTLLLVIAMVTFIVGAAVFFSFAAAAAEPETVIIRTTISKQVVAPDSNTWTCSIRGYAGPDRHGHPVAIVITNGMTCVWHPLHWYWRRVASWTRSKTIAR